VRIHVWRDNDHIQVPVTVWVEIVADIQLRPHAAHKVRPEELAHGNAVGFAMFKRRLHAFGF